MFKLNFNRQTLLIGVAILGIIITGVLILADSSSSNILSSLKSNFLNSPKTTAENAVAYLNSNVLKDGQTASMNSFSVESGVIKVNIKITSAEGAKDYDSYVTKDGKLFFPDVLVLDQSKKNQTADTATQTPVTLAKVDKPLLEAFVVSACPFGLQMQRAIASALKSVPTLAQHIKIKYIGSIENGIITAMHGQEEAKENLRQICIRDEQQSKYWAYVSCYMQKSAGNMPNGMPYGDTKTCQETAKIDTAKLNGCVTNSNRGLAYAKEDFDLAAKYNDTPECKADPTKCAVGGSPALMLNGTSVSEFDFGGRSADTIRNLICSSSVAAPDFCGTKLDTNQASTSFSLTYAPATGTVASASNNSCAPSAQ